MGMVLGASPDLGAVAKAFLSVGLVLDGEQRGRVSDLHAHAGRRRRLSGIHHGNLINMKIPCAVNARDIVGAKTGNAGE